jgi:hypothetical protein
LISRHAVALPCQKASLPSDRTRSLGEVSLSPQQLLVLAPSAQRLALGGRQRSLLGQSQHAQRLRHDCVGLPCPTCLTASGRPRSLQHHHHMCSAQLFRVLEQIVNPAQLLDVLGHTYGRIVRQPGTDHANVFRFAEPLSR